MRLAWAIKRSSQVMRSVGFGINLKVLFGFAGMEEEVLFQVPFRYIV